MQGGMRLEGASELDKALGKLPFQVQKKVLHKTMKKAAAPITKAAKANLAAKGATDTRLLQRSIGVRIKRYVSGVFVAVIGPRSKGFNTTKIRSGLEGAKAKRQPHKYAHLIERGTKRHRQRRAKIGSQWVTFPGGEHPGAKAKPFMEPAFDHNREKALSEMMSELRAGIERIARGLAKKGVSRGNA